MNAALLRPGSGGAPGARRLRTPRASYPGALSASSMLWAALFLAAWAVLSALPSAAPRPSTHAPGPIVHFGPTMIPALLSPALPRPTVAPRVAGSGVVVPVEMPDALPGEVPVETPPVFDTGSPGEPPGRGAREAPMSAPAPAALPPPGAYVPHDLEPEALVRVEPVYPDLAREAGIEGTVTLLVLVGASGRVVDVRVLSSQPMLDAAATEALRRWVFRPALAGTHPVAVWVAIPVHFTLHGR